jgi:two-component system, chemotaxis family, chemotaxis protein CheY
LARILVVDDDAIVRNLLCIVLKQLGHEVVEAQNGREGLQHYQAAPAALVITDIQMPEMNGLQMIKEIRHDFPEAVIIAISADFRHSRAAVEALGVHSTFEKPFSLITLRDTVQELLLQFSSQPCRDSGAKKDWSWEAVSEDTYMVSHTS